MEKVRGPLDALAVSGGHGHPRAADGPGPVAHVRRLSRESRRVVPVGTGFTVLAAADLLEPTASALPDVAAQRGLVSAEPLRQVFLERYGAPPSRHRAAHRDRPGRR